VNKHLPLNFVAITCGGIGLEVTRKLVLELQRNSTTHDADAIDGVH
jgi:hypothetical protein